MKDNSIRIANCSGFYGDKLSIARDMIEGGPIDVLTGDYLAELTMTILYNQKLKRGEDHGYVGTFLKQFRDVAKLAQEKGVDLRIGYSQRFLQKYFVAHDEISKGKLGPILGGMTRVYNTRTNMLEILKRCPEATPILDIITYNVDYIGWCLGPDVSPVEVQAMGHGTIFRPRLCVHCSHWCYRASSIVSSQEQSNDSNTHSSNTSYSGGPILPRFRPSLVRAHDIYASTGIR